MFNYDISILVSLLAAIVSLPNATQANTPPSEFAYLNPQEIPDLPKEVALELQLEGCLVPKWSYKFGGFTKGEFAAPGQIDLAVVCKFIDGSKIRIFWGGPNKCESSVNSHGQYIRTVDSKFIFEHYQRYGGPKPPEITHDAIDDVFVEASSIVKYCDRGKWVDLRGAD